jgi:hypothetical protein
MDTPLQLGRHEGRDVLLLRIATAHAWPAALRLPSPRFVMLLTWDARSASAEEIGQLADKALDHGLAYLCAWGPDCERVHDVFDEVCVERDLNGSTGASVMTTWHDDEPLEAAARFAIRLAVPDPELKAGCDTVFAVCIGDGALAQQLDRALRAASDR